MTLNKWALKHVYYSYQKSKTRETNTLIYKEYDYGQSGSYISSEINHLPDCPHADEEMS